MQPTLIVGDSHVHYLSAIHKQCPNMHLLGAIGRTLYAIEKGATRAKTLVHQHNIQNLIVLMGTNDISGLLLYFKHCGQQKTLRYSTTIAKKTLQLSVERCARFVQLMLTHRPTLRVHLCDVFKEHHPPHVQLWNTYHFLLTSKCTTPNLARQHHAFLKDLHTSSVRDKALRQHSYYTHPFFKQHITKHERVFVETVVQHYAQHRRWLNVYLARLCRANRYTFVRLSRHVNRWNKQACAMYQTAYNSSLLKTAPFDMHYVSELMAISLLDALATDTTLVSPPTTRRLTKRLYKQYTKRRRVTGSTAKICRYGSRKRSGGCRKHYWQILNNAK